MEAMGTCEICNIPGKGMGVKAKRDIKKGEIIFTERPILRYTGGENELLSSKDVNFRKIYDGEFQMLSRNVKEDIMKLGNRAKLQSNDEFLQLVGIWATNSFGLDMEISESGEKQTGLFIDASKFNHGCIANAEYHFTESNMRFYATQDIDKGNEICISYIDCIHFEKPPTIANVREKLKVDLNFDCKCELCEMNDTKKRTFIEKHRIKYWELDKKFNQLIIKDKINPQESLKLYEELLDEMKLAKRVSPWKMASIASIGLASALVCKQDTKVEYFIKQQYEAYVAMNGINHSETIHFGRLMNNPLYRQSNIGVNSPYMKKIKANFAHWEPADTLEDIEA